MVQKSEELIIFFSILLIFFISVFFSFISKFNSKFSLNYSERVLFLNLRAVYLLLWFLFVLRSCLLLYLRDFRTNYSFLEKFSCFYEFYYASMEVLFITFACTCFSLPFIKYLGSVQKYSFFNFLFFLSMHEYQCNLNINVS